MSLKPIVTLLVCILLTSCDKKDDDPYNPWPVWILDVRAQNGFTRLPVESCIRVLWRVSGSTEITTSECSSSSPDYARVWQSITEPVTVTYRVECNGYFNTGEFSAYFDPELAYTRPGAPGDEVIESVTVSMYPD